MMSIGGYPMVKPTYEELEQRIKGLEREAEKARKAEEALRESQENLSQIVQSLSIPTFVIDANHVITHYNKALENLTGISADHLILDKTPAEDMPRYYRERYRESAVIDGGYEAEDFFSELGERGKWVFFTAAPLRNSEGEVTGAIETLQDVTERKQSEEALQRSERRFRAFLDFLPYPVVVFSLDGTVYYLNPEFTSVFGWSLEELAGKSIPYVPPGLEQETRFMIKKLFEEKTILHHETKRLAKDGRVLDVTMRGAIYSESKDEPAGEIVLLRDITRQKRIARNNEATLRISTALPKYPDLEELLDYVSNEIKGLLGAEGALVILLDEERKELFTLGAAYEDTATERRVKEIRFSMDELVAGKVIKSGEPIIVADTSVDPHLHSERDKRLGYQTRNLVEVPLRSSDRIIGVLCAINKKEALFDQTDVELLNVIAGTVALSIENARFSQELKMAYKEVTSMNRAKDKVINHLSHELKTPVSVLSASLVTLAKRLKGLPEQTWKRTIERAQRNLDRILEIQYQVDDIMRDKKYKAHDLLSVLFDECGDELEALIAQEIGEGPLIERVRKRVEEIFGAKEVIPKKILLDEFVRERLERLKPLYSHRRVTLLSHLEPTPPIYIPADVLTKIIDGVVKNAIENTPDEGKVEVTVQKRNGAAELVVRDYGVGITEGYQRRIFEGFFATQDTMDYSSKRPFDFNAGGRGADLLRMKIFSERYNFRIHMVSSRCGFIPGENDICPGRIHECAFCTNTEDCYRSGGTVFSFYFPPAPKEA
jgi:PAS domain S-box-containing protein